MTVYSHNNSSAGLVRVEVDGHSILVHPDCNYCTERVEAGSWFFPAHWSGVVCQSSGGRPHCSCDTCF